MVQLTSRSLLRLAMRTWVRKVAAPSGVTTLLTASRPIPWGGVVISGHGHAGWPWHGGQG